MNPDLQSAAEGLVHALLWLAEDALVMRRVPSYNPVTDPDGGPEQEAAALQAYYLPHRRLPPVGQDLWRDLQGQIDQRFLDPRPIAQTPADELVRFHKTVDALLDWLVATYEFGVKMPDKGRPKPRDRTPHEQPDKNSQKQLLLRHMLARLGTPGENRYTAYSQTQLAELVGCSQSHVSEFASTLFEGRGWKGYHELIESYARRGNAPRSAVPLDGREVADETEEEGDE